MAILRLSKSLKSMKSRLLLLIASIFMLFSFVSCDENDISNVEYSIMPDIFSEAVQTADVPEEELTQASVENTVIGIQSETDANADISGEAETESTEESTKSAEAPVTESVSMTEPAAVTATPAEDSLPTTPVLIPSEALIQADTENAVSEPLSQEKEIVPDASNCDYVLNKNSKKIHYPNCSSVKSMAAHNTLYFIGTKDEAIAMGYKPCGRCKP